VVDAEIFGGEIAVRAVLGAGTTDSATSLVVVRGVDTEAVVQREDGLAGVDGAVVFVFAVGVGHATILDGLPLAAPCDAEVLRAGAIIVTVRRVIAVWGDVHTEEPDTRVLGQREAVVTVFVDLAAIRRSVGRWAVGAEVVDALMGDARQRAQAIVIGFAAEEWDVAHRMGLGLVEWQMLAGPIEAEVTGAGIRILAKGVST